MHLHALNVHHIHSGVREARKGYGSPKNGATVVVKHLMWALGTKSGSSARASNPLNYWPISLAPKHLNNFWISFTFQRKYIFLLMMDTGVISFNIIAIIHPALFCFVSYINTIMTKV